MRLDTLTEQTRRRILEGIRRGRRKRLEQYALLYGEGQAQSRWLANFRENGKKMALIGLGGLALSAILWLGDRSSAESLTELPRPGSGSGSQAYLLSAQTDGQTVDDIAIQVQERHLSRQDCRKLLDMAQDELSQSILGENPSFEEIYGDLCLQTEVCGGQVSVRWESSDYELVDSGGRVENFLLQEARPVTLDAWMTCQDQSRAVSFPLLVMPRELDLAGQLSKEAALAALSEGETDRQEPTWKLPAQFQGKELLWSYGKKKNWPWGLLLTVVGVAAVAVSFSQETQKEMKRREESLRGAYPGFLARLSMMAETGLPLRMAFKRLAKKGEEDPLSMELARTCREMESGTTQTEAFLRFGKRCGIACYQKCASLLEQQLRRGSDGLLENLRREAEDAFEERRSYARRKGEEAQTKMLLPMVMLLATVMLMVMAPAAMSFSGM